MPTAMLEFPQIRDVGLTAKLVSFANTLSEPANRAALAFRAAIDAQKWKGIEETATSLASTFIRFDPLTVSHEALESLLADLLTTSDWFDADLPAGRTLWTIPVDLGGDHGPQFEDAIDCAGLTDSQARHDITNTRIRVLSIGFAPGQPYMGELPPAWDIPRMTQLNPQVPGASLVVAIRQLIIFAGPAPTGWRHIGQTAFECFRPQTDTPFPLSPGDEVHFREVDAVELQVIRETDASGDGGATREPLA